MDQNQIRDQVKDYYGKTLQNTDDLKTNACCTTVSYPTHIKKALKNISDEVLAKYYGCGLTIPTKVKGLRVLDLGSGSGRDCFLLSQLVGECGSVVGVDMTPEQLAVARNNIEFHKEKFGYKKSNVEFVDADIQKLREAGLKEKDFDLMISNCVVNLAPDKHAVLTEALYWNDFENLAKKVGFADPRVVESSQITVRNPALEQKLQGYEFYSVTYRLFKISQLEPHCEEYGQAVIYRGGIQDQEQAFILDDHHVFLKNKVERVCGNSYLMLNATRYKDNFEFIGNFENHYGIYEDCGVFAPFKVSPNSGEVSSNTVEDTTQGCC